MPFLIEYLLKLSISLAVVFLFYQLLLRRLTFYNWNRYYLIGYAVLSFFIPFVNIAPLVESKNLDQAEVINYIPVINNYIKAPSNATPHVHSHVFTYWNIFLFLIFLGSFIMLIRLFIHFFSLQKIKRSAVIINSGEAEIYQVNENIIPFSFGNAIYINQQLHTEKEFEEIILHEYVHVKQNHTLDILAAEMLCVINWFNPFAWLIRHSIRQNLEFIADDFVLKSGLDKKAYQYHLLKVVGTPQYRIANNFNFSSLKKRIAMMNKLKSARLHLIKFLFVLPLIAVLLVAFRDKYKNIFGKDYSVCNIKGMVIDALTNAPLANVAVEETNAAITATTNEQGIYSLSLPLEKDSLKLNFNLRKIGYNHGAYRYNYPGKFQGFVNVMGMFDTVAKHVHKVMMFTPGGKTFNSSPESKDVRVLYEETVKENKESQSFHDFYNRYPDLTFFTSEDKKKQIVVSKSGSVEKYGYSHGPTITDMEKKYGNLPDMFTNPRYGGGKDYVARWQKISEKAEKNFHTTNPDVKEIIFPGDSRVIVVLKDGSKPKFYDMDNAVPEERPAFEKLYGSLDGIVPPAANYVNGAHNDALYKDWTINGIMFLGFEKIDFDKENSVTYLIGEGTLKINNASRALILYHNKEYDPALFKQQFNNLQTGGVMVYENEGAFKNFGEKGRHGVVVINDDSKKQTTNENSYRKSDSVPVVVKTSGKDIDQALYVIDGIEIPNGLNWANLINPSAIKSMNVLKGEMATNKYRDKGKNGVIEITTNMLSKNKLDTLMNTPGIVRVEHISGKVGPLYIVNGKEAAGIGNLNPDQIESIKVLKDSSAIKQYGEKGRNGVIIIKTKNPQSLNFQNLKSQPTHSETSYIDDVSVQNGMINWQIKKEEKSYPKHPLYLVNGKIAGKEPKRINIDTGDMQIAEFAGKGVKLKQYGTDGEGGIINFVTKSEKDNKAAYIFPRELSVDYV